jgi:3-hydroxyisobutyrate dehydrogenase-like beta-hydroxyacid dehydrogenase
MSLPKVGFIGLGVLGIPIVERLLSAGLTVTVHDVRDEPVSTVVAAGAGAAGSAAETAAVSDVSIVCVRTDEQCVDVVTGPEGLLAGAKPGHVIALASTVHPDTATTLAGAAASRDVELLDAPLAGTGPEGVRAGSMWALAGGTEAGVAAVEPVLAVFCERVLHAGPVGSGSAVKLAHNVMIYLGYLGAYEAAGLARVSGVRDGVLAEVTRATGALSSQADLFLGIHERRRELATDTEADYFRGASALLAKDLGHAIELALQHHLELPGAALTRLMGDALYQVKPKAEA